MYIEFYVVYTDRRANSIGLRSHDRKMAEDTKNLLALLNGLARRSYYNEPEYTNEVLHEQIYPNLSQEEFNTVALKSTNILKVSTICVWDTPPFVLFLKTCPFDYACAVVTVQEKTVLSKRTNPTVFCVAQ